MAHPHPATLVKKLAARSAGTAAGPAPCSVEIPTANYTDQVRFEREHRLFLRHPLVLGHASQLAEAGAALVWDWLGLPLMLFIDNQPLLWLPWQPARRAAAAMGGGGEARRREAQNLSPDPDLAAGIKPFLAMGLEGEVRDFAGWSPPPL